MRGNDRTVHAENGGTQVVRYDRAGKWYIEYTNPDLKRRAVSVTEAAITARNLITMRGTWHKGLPGGAMFDAIVAGKR